MSCRETPGNSAVTSLARFQTGLPEKVVSREFHAARRDAARRLGADAKNAEPAHNVADFLTQIRGTIENDTQMRPRNKTSLLERVRRAEAAAINGTGLPNRATFAAWKNLHNYLNGHRAASYKASQHAGTPVTASEVEAAAAELQHAKNLLVAERQSVSQQSRIAKVAEAQERYRKLQAAYDATPQGFTELRHLFRNLGATDVDVAARWAEANRRLERQPRSRARPERGDLEALARAASAARAEAAHATAVHTVERNADTAKKAAEAVERSRTARAAYLDTVADVAPLPPLLSREAQFSVQAWAATAKEGFSRGELWAAAEYRLASADAAALADGKYGRQEVARRAARRAAARSAALSDSSQQQRQDGSTHRLKEAPL